MSVHIYTWECAHECNCLQLQKLKASDSLKLPDMGSRNRTCVLYRSSMHS